MAVAISTHTTPAAPYRMAASEVAAALGVDPVIGLSDNDIRDRLRIHGLNQLDEAARRPACLRFADQSNQYSSWCWSPRPCLPVSSVQVAIVELAPLGAIFDTAER